MLLHHSPCHRSLIGSDTHSGWLPLGAAQPLPEPPQAAILDIRLLREGAQYLLSWCAHDPSLWALPSARDDRTFAAYTDAVAAAEAMFGIGPTDWTFNFATHSATAADLEQLISLVLQAHDVEAPEAHGWGHRQSPPHVACFDVPGGKEVLLWLLLRGTDYVVFYDPSTGDCGLGTTNGAGQYTYIGDYGPLWATLQSM